MRSLETAAAEKRGLELAWLSQQRQIRGLAHEEVRQRTRYEGWISSAEENE